MDTNRLKGRNHYTAVCCLVLALSLLTTPFTLLLGSASGIETDANASTDLGTGMGLEVTDYIDATVKAGTSTIQEIRISNTSDKDATATLSVTGEAQSWVGLSDTNTAVKAKTSQAIKVTISVPVTVEPGSYTAHIVVISNIGVPQSIFVKVKVPLLALKVSPENITVVMKPNSIAEATVLLINAGDVEISGVRLAVSGGAASMIQLSTSLVTLKAQGVAEAKLTINSGDLAEGTYKGKVVMTSEDGTTDEVTVTINVRATASPAAETKVTSSGGLMLQVDGGERARASSTVSINPELLSVLGISIQVTPGASVDIVARHSVSGEIAKVADVDFETKGSSQGGLDIDVSVDVKAGTKSGIYTGTVTLETKSGAKIEVPVTAVVNMKAVANGALLIDGSDEDWSKVKIKANTADDEGDVEGADDSVDIIVARLTDTENTLLVSVKVVGDVDSNTRVYGIRFDTNNDAKTDFTLEFKGDQAVLVDASGKTVASVSTVAWMYSSGTLEAAVDKQQFSGAVGSEFRAQAFAQGSYDETAWFPEAQTYSMAVQSTSTQSPTSTPIPTNTPTSASPAEMNSTIVIIGAAIVTAIVAGIVGVIVRRRK